jgi:hypothetical protein
MPKMTGKSFSTFASTFSGGLNSQICVAFRTFCNRFSRLKIVYTVIACRIMLSFRTKSHECLTACNGALLVVDASQGIEQAQTLAITHLVLENGLAIVPVLSKSADSDHATRPEFCAQPGPDQAHVGTAKGYIPKYVQPTFETYMTEQ